MTHYILVTGCSGGGKSTRLAALKDAGHAVIEEPGRRIVAEEMAGGGAALPWNDLAAFARRGVEMSREDFEQARSQQGPIFFDRGLIDAAVALEHAACVPLEETLAGASRYGNPVFLTPPWQEIFSADPERRHGYADAVAEYSRLERALARHGCQVLVLPKMTVADRLAFVVANGIGPGA